MKTCDHCGASLVAAEEYRAHADGTCAALAVAPPPNLAARLREREGKRAMVAEAKLAASPRREQQRRARQPRPGRRNKFVGEFAAWLAARGPARATRPSARAFLRQKDDDWQAGPDEERAKKVEALLRAHRRAKPRTVAG